MATTKNVETKHDVITFEEASKMSVKELLESKIAIETAIHMDRETTTCRNKYFLIGAIRSLVAGVGKGYRTKDDYTMARYYTCYASDGVTDYEIPGTKNIRIYGLHDIMPEKECIVKIMSPAGSLVPKTVYVDGIKYKVTVVKSHNYSEQIDY